MKRLDKKTDNTIVKVLNEVCESLKNESIGFSWLTHFADYTHFPQSLRIVFVFETNQHLDNAKSTARLSTITQNTESLLKQDGIVVIHADKTIAFDTEENGANIDSPKWCRQFN